MTDLRGRSFHIILTFSFLVILSACSLKIPGSLFQTPTATEIPTQTPSPTATNTPLPTATPTPPPASRISTGDHEFLNGDYDAALESYKLAFDLTTDQEIKAAALTMTGRIYFLQQKTQEALITLRQVTENYSSPDSLSMAYIYLAQIYDQLQRPGEAAAAYQSYLNLKPGYLDSFFLEKKGDALTANGQFAEANQVYTSAIGVSPVSPTTSLDLKIAGNMVSLGDAETAIQRYQFVETSTTNDYAKAQAEFLIGQIYLNQGDTVSAYEHFQNDVNNYPRAYDSYSALVALVNAGEKVNDLNRGIVDYYAGQYAAAIDALNNYEKEFVDHDGTSHYYRALAYTSLNDYPSAILQWDALIQEHSGDRFWTTAWDEKAYTQWADQNKYKDAAQTLLDFITTAPQDPQAPAFLFEAARIYERGNYLDEAATTWERLATEYPSSTQAYSGIYLSGITRFRQNNYESGLGAFQRALLLAANPSDTASAYLWIGKIQMAMNNPAKAREAWQQAVEKDPTGYYSERARDLLTGRTPFAPCQVFDLAVDLESEKPAAIDWMRKTFNLAADVDLVGLGNLSQDPAMIRGKEYWRLGFYEEARSEFENLRLARELDAVDTFRLTQFFSDLGLYRSAVFAARQVLSLGGLDDNATFNAPVYFNHIRFGAYYREVIMQASQAEKLDPLLLLSLVRQESLFEGFIQSTAGARGLMQLLPATARETSANMGWPPVFLDQDIYRPYINIRLGSHYLRQQIDYQNGDMYAALAGYNSGPGNAQIWGTLSNGDPDLYLEVVRYQETRQYIRNIVELFNIYRMFYCRGQ